MMKYSKKKLVTAAIAALAVALAAFAAWRLAPMSAASMRGSALIVEQSAWHEISIDGKPRLYFSASMGDSVLLGVTANRDSAAHHKRVAGCWIDRWTLLPSCGGRVATVYCPAPRTPALRGDSAIVRLCRQSIATQLKTLKTQKSELDYYLRVHGVQDNGYQTIAALAGRITKAYDDVARAGHLLDSLTSGGRHRLAVKSVTEYVAISHGSDGKPRRTPLLPLSADRKGGTMLLRAADGTTPDGACPLSPMPWGKKAERDIRAVGFPGLGEEGLECDTVAPIIVPGHKLRGTRHDIPRVLAADGAPVFTAKGRFIGIINGNSIALYK